MPIEVQKIAFDVLLVVLGSAGTWAVMRYQVAQHDRQLREIGPRCSDHDKRLTTLEADLKNQDRTLREGLDRIEAQGREIRAEMSALNTRIDRLLEARG